MATSPMKHVAEKLPFSVLAMFRRKSRVCYILNNGNRCKPVMSDCNVASQSPLRYRTSYRAPKVIIAEGDGKLELADQYLSK